MECGGGRGNGGMKGLTECRENLMEILSSLLTSMLPLTD